MYKDTAVTFGDVRTAVLQDIFLRLTLGHRNIPDTALKLCAKAFRAAAVDKSAVFEQQAIVGYALNIGHYVRCENDYLTKPYLRNDIAKTHTLFRVKPCGRLVKNQNLRIVQKCKCNTEPALHSAAVTLYLPAFFALQINKLEQLRYTLFAALDITQHSIVIKRLLCCE